MVLTGDADIAIEDDLLATNHHLPRALLAGPRALSRVAAIASTAGLAELACRKRGRYHR